VQPNQGREGEQEGIDKAMRHVTTTSFNPSGLWRQWLTSLPVISCSGGIDLEDLSMIY